MLKVIFRKSDGRLLGAQALGQDGVEKRIDALAMAIQIGRDGVRPGRSRALLRASLRKRQGSGQLRRAWSRPMSSGATCRSVTGTRLDGGFLLDVRNPPELAVEQVPGAVNIPLPELRARLGELPRDREIQVICRSAVRGLLRDAHPSAERVQGPEHLRRHAVPFDARGKLKWRSAATDMDWSLVTGAVITMFLRG